MLYFSAWPADRFVPPANRKGNQEMKRVFVVCVALACAAAVQAADFKATAYPSDSEISTYAQNVWNAYTNKLQAIMTEKWINFNIKQATQAWTDIRRTGYPALTYPQDGADNNGYKTIPQRVKYPNTEFNNNKANYSAAAAKVNNDSAYCTLFWAKELK